MRISNWAWSGSICSVALGLVLFFTGCTSREEPRLPEDAKYHADSALLVNTSQKLSEESDVHKLHSIAMALQTTRTLACIDFNDECSMFGKFLSFAIEVSAKGSLTLPERKKLREKAGDIRLAVEQGKLKLHEARAKQQKK